MTKSLIILMTSCEKSAYSKDTTLLQGNIEKIFLAALTQMINPGNPFIYAFGPSVSNMKSGHDRYYTLDKILWKIATTELAKVYNMPTSAECGGTMSHRYDMQSGAESMLFMLTAQNSGADLLTGLGSCYNANGLSSEMIVIQSEWLKAAKFLSKGINTEYLEEGIESIKTQGIGGNFLIDDLTIKLLRRDEFFTSSLFTKAKSIIKETGCSPTVVLLHVPRSGRLADPEVQKGVRALAQQYPGVSIILVRCGRCYLPAEISVMR